MPQFFCKSTDITDNSLHLTNVEDINHLKNVLRCNIDDKLTCIDENEIEYQTVITSVDAGLITAKIINSQKVERSLKTKITLAQSVLKAQGQDILIQKTTELGVNSIVPMLTDRTVVKLPSEADKAKKVQRFQKIADQACKQCERSSRLTVEEVSSIEAVLSREFDIKIACVERAAKSTIKQALKTSKPDSVLLLIGPEGGWSNSEIELFNEYDVQKVSLGTLILRAETAAIKAVSDVVYEYEL